MKKNYYNKKRLEIIDKLIVFLDELDNKPRRFFEALKEFAEEFNKYAVPNIEELETAYYQYLREGEKIAMLFDTLREYQAREERQVPDQSEIRTKGAQEFMKLYIKNYLDDRLY